MIEKCFGRKINEMMKKEDPRTVLKETAKAVSFYSRKVNDAFPCLYAEDAPYILAALDTFRNALVKELDPNGEGLLEEAAKSLGSNFNVFMNAIYTAHPITETAAREAIKAMREREGSEE